MRKILLPHLDFELSGRVACLCVPRAGRFGSHIGAPLPGLFTEHVQMAQGLGDGAGPTGFSCLSQTGQREETLHSSQNTICLLYKGYSCYMKEHNCT